MWPDATTAEDEKRFTANTLTRLQAGSCQTVGTSHVTTVHARCQIIGISHVTTLKAHPDTPFRKS